ncbi:MAG: histidine phosphatase family protein, partial [Rhodopila sp.]
ARSQVVDGRDKPGQDGTKIKQPPVTSSINAVFASSLRRARLPAEYIAAALGLPLRLDARLAERCFGTWEGRCWDEIWAETGSAMDGMINTPSSYRPGGGETTTELAERVLDWFHSLPAGTAAVAVSHGGPIAALAGRLCNEPVRDWLRFVPACGEGLLIVPAADEWEVATWQPAPWNVFSDG